jgi:NAD(P)-dependent dehydrogenase (short-subunit alcohol dehydrogenase family)
VQRFGRLDTVVHLAGAVGKGPLVDVALEEWRRLLDVNLTSAFLVARATHEALKASAGSLLLTASVNARNGGSALSGPAYAVAKAGIVNLTRYLAKEWGGDGIRVNCIAPGPVNTPMVARLPADTIEGLRKSVPLGRIAQPGDVASVVSFLCSPAALYLTGTTLNVSGGLLLD